MVARGVVLPSFFGAAMGAAIPVRIAATALGRADNGNWAGWLLPPGVVVFVLVAGLELTRFRRVTGVWSGGFASRVVGGTATAGGVALAAYACSGRRLPRTYRAGPAARGRGESAAVLAVLAILAVAGLVPVVGR